MNVGRSIEKVYSSKYLRILLHGLFWLVMLGLQVYLNSISFNPYKSFPGGIFYQVQISGIISQMLFYYPFMYFVLPRLFYEKRILAGIIATLVLAALYAILEALRERLILNPCVSCMEVFKKVNIGYYVYLQRSFVHMVLAKVLTFGTMIGLLFSLSIPVGIKMGISAFRQQIRSMQLAKENLQLEFNFLRSQVNPHFLFNSLNNIYGLILNNDNDRSAETVARLSQFLRYSLYENNITGATEKELQLLKDYVALESIRLNFTKVDFTVRNDGSVPFIPSLLMIPVIENAFKYCADERDTSIKIDLSIRSKKIYFAIANPVDTRRQSASAGGIGLKNFHKRLELYYPGRFTYEVTSSETNYVATINIDSND